jgi:hypothetical protein
MPRSGKSKDSDKHGRKADHLTEGYEQRHIPYKEAARRNWAIINKNEGDDGDGKKSSGGSGHG